MRIEIVNNTNEFLKLGPIWNEIVLAGNHSSIFQSFEWHVSWWNTLRQNEVMLVLLLYDQNLEAIIPWMISERQQYGLSQRVISFIGTGVSDYCDFIYRNPNKEIFQTVLAWLKNNNDWDLVDLSHLRQDSPTCNGLLTESKTMLCLREKQFEAPCILLEDQNKAKELLQKQSLKRHYAYFAKKGSLIFKNCQNIQEALLLLEEFFKQHISRWESVGITSQFLKLEQKNFFSELIQKLLPAQWLIFSVVLWNQIPIAFHIGFEFKKRFIWYKPSFDVTYAKHSPGEVLLKCLLEHAISKELSEFDFTIGKESFKYRFANHIRQVYSLRVYRRRLSYYSAKLLLFSRNSLKQLKRVFKKD